MDEQQDDLLEIECRPGRVLYFHGARLSGPDFFSSPEEQRDFTYRQVCHFLIDQIDSRGMEEVCQSLVELFEYYRPTHTSSQLLPESQSRNAAFGTRSVAAPFVIEGE